MNDEFESPTSSHEQIILHEFVQLLDGKAIDPLAAIDSEGPHQTVIVTCDVQQSGVFDLRITCSPMRGSEVDYSGLALAAYSEREGSSRVVRLTKDGCATLKELNAGQYTLGIGPIALFGSKENHLYQRWMADEIVPLNTVTHEKTEQRDVPNTRFESTSTPQSVFGGPPAVVENDGIVMFSLAQKEQNRLSESDIKLDLAERDQVFRPGHGGASSEPSQGDGLQT